MKTFMNKLSKIARRIFSADIKTQIEAGYLTTDLKLTDAGQLALMHIVYEANSEALTAVGQELLDRQKAEKKNGKCADSDEDAE